MNAAWFTFVPEAEAEDAPETESDLVGMVWVGVGLSLFGAAAEPAVAAFLAFTSCSCMGQCLNTNGRKCLVVRQGEQWSK